MKTKNELAMAGIVCGIMLIVCLIMIAVFNGEKEINIEVHKHVSINGQEGWIPCSVPETILAEIETEYNKAIVFNDATKVASGTIEGKYRVVRDDKRIVFDNDTDNIMFNEKEYKLYNFESTMYNLVINVCE